MLLAWALNRAGGLGPILEQPSQFAEGGKKAGQFSAAFWPSLTAMVGFWATLALNIPDFTRFAKSQRDQIVGQAIGLPVPMGLLAGLAVVVTSATVVIYGKAIWDPVDLASRMTGAAVLIGLIVLLVDTVSVNLAANLVGPAYDFSALNPRAISYRTGGYITAGIAIAMMPWKLLESTQGYIFTWLIGYSALLGPIAGILIADYYLVRRTQLAVADLYSDHGQYRYRNGWNPAAIAAFVIGVLPNLPGFLNAALPAVFPNVPEFFKTIYTYAWFAGIAVFERGVSARDASAGAAGAAATPAFGGLIMASTPALLIRGGTVVNAEGEARADVLCVDGRIVAVGTDAASQAPAGAQLLDASGSTSCPAASTLTPTCSCRSWARSPWTTSSPARPQALPAGPRPSWTS